MSLFRWVKPTHLAVTIATFALSACQSPEPPITTDDQPTAQSGITLTHMDTSTRPQDDLYQFVNGTWITETAIPPDRSSYGSFYVLREEATANVRSILESLIASSEPLTPDAEKATTLYQTFMDETAIENAGIQPYIELAQQIDDIDSKQALMAFMAKAG